MAEHELKWNRTVSTTLTDEEVGAMFREARKELERLGGDLIRNKRFRHAVDQIDKDNMYLTLVMQFDGILQPEVQRLRLESMSPADRRVAALKGLFN